MCKQNHSCFTHLASIIQLLHESNFEFLCFASFLHKQTTLTPAQKISFQIAYILHSNTALARVCVCLIISNRAKIIHSISLSLL